MSEKKYILITGTGFVNKGSQAMLFNAVDELKKRFPDKEVIDLSTLDYNKGDVTQYNFKIMPDNLSLFIPKKYAAFRDLGKRLLNYKGKKIADDEQEKWKKQMEEIYNNTYFIVNAGGFALGAPIGRGKSATSMAFLMRIMAADNLGIPIYLLPQSFGPFNYLPGHKQLVLYFMKKYLHKARLIFAREIEGYKLLKPYKKDGLILCKDIVITNKDIKEQNIYKNPSNSVKKIKIKGENPIAVIPNMMCFENTNRDEFIKIYRKIIAHLQEKNEVYLLRHSKEDIEACELIYNSIENKRNVYMLTDEMNCFELEYVLQQFKYCIASRFHSIVHSYKNGTPCVVIAWAVKYYDLMESFKQESYLFDVREDMNVERIISKIDEMEKNYLEEKEIIAKCLSKQQEINAFDIIEEDIKNV
jgi:polysaccharide pyruvyl transferase WcaK-like protein